MRSGARSGHRLVRSISHPVFNPNTALQRREFSTYYILKMRETKSKSKKKVPKRKIFPPPAGETVTACTDLGPGQVGETNLRHSSF